MIRIYISTPDIETLHDIEDQLEDAGIDYEYDSGDRLIVDNEDVDTAIEIIEDCGGDPEIIYELDLWWKYP